MPRTQGIIDWNSKQTAGGHAVALPTDKQQTDTVFFQEASGYLWRPVQLPYEANWDSLQHDGQQFVIAASGNARVRAVSLDGQVWKDVDAL